MWQMIFVGGIHGVGKTYLCDLICSKIEAVHFTASNLIDNEIKKSGIGKRDLNYLDNQRILVQAVKNRGVREKQTLVDGHFCLSVSGKNFIDIPLAVFEDMNLKGVIVLKDDVTKIKKRLKDRKGGENDDLKFLENFQKREVEWAQHVCESLSIRILIATPNEEELILNFIASINIK